MTHKKTCPTRDKILKTAGQLFSRKGYFGVSMRDIADHLSVTKAALYYHFPGKEALTEELLRNTVNDLKKELRKSCDRGILPSDKLFNVVKTFLDYKISHPELSLLVSLGFTDDEKSPVFQFVQDLRIELTRFIRELVGGIDFVRRISYKTVFLITSSLLGLVFSPFQNTISPDIARDFTDVLLSGTTVKKR